MELTYSVQNNISKIGEIDSTIEKLKQKNLAVSKLQIIEYAYEKQFLKYENSTMNNILYGRKNVSYLIPVANKSMPTNPSIIPNAGRPYRSDTTDGIHHGWDLMSPIGTPVRAMADGVVIRIVDNFSWSYFDQIKK
jgi:murein DD-endopeptidase MepM/ murein hydrolase activator NlpD